MIVYVGYYDKVIGCNGSVLIIWNSLDLIGEIILEWNISWRFLWFFNWEVVKRNVDLLFSYCVVFSYFVYSN